MKNPIWRFPTTFEGGGIGFNDGGTQLFKDDSIQSLAREVCQNSIDARVKDSLEPAIVEFKLFKIKNNEFPGFEKFASVLNDEIKHCKLFYKNNETALHYYQSALKTLLNDEILCLRISDFNTTGLTVSGEHKNSNWSNLVVHSGTNDKNPEDGGSFGLGKNAMYACSKFGALYFSTNTDEGIKRSECVAKLSYYYDDLGNIIHGLGFYGNYKDEKSDEGDMPINDICHLDKDFHDRENRIGTDVYILGFEMPNDNLFDELIEDYSEFEKNIASALIDNYFVSILENKLVVKINNIELNKDNLFDMFDNIYATNPKLFNDNTKDYLQIMKEEATVYPISIMHPNVNDAELRLVLNPEFHNRVAMIKNTGMKIFDKGNFPQITIFAGILILRTKEVNGYFKTMENPAHDDWILERIKADKAAKHRYESMLSQIREIMKKLAEQNAPESIDVAGLGEYLPDDIDDGTDDNKKEAINDDYAEKLEVIERKQIPLDQKIFSSEEGNEESVSGSGDPDDNGEYEANYGDGNSNKTDGGNITSNNSSEGEGTLNISKGKLIKNVSKRCFYNNETHLYTLFITSPEKINDCKINIQLSGEQSNFDSKLDFARINSGIFRKKQLKINNNSINVGKIERNEKVELTFKLKNENNYAMEVEVYEN